MTDKHDWDMPSIIDRFSTICDMHDAEFELDKSILAEELESMAIWLRS